MTEERYVSISLRFIKLLMGHLHKRAARAWRKFDCYLDILYSFAVHSASDVESDTEHYKSAPYDVNGDAYKIGIEYYFKKSYLTLFADFIL